MFDTTVTIIGNALNAPELRRTTGTNTLVASFRVASTSRRYDRDNGRWVDGPSLRVRVTCWRRLAEGVAQSIVTGDPLVVTGRMYTRDWIGDDGQQRVSYELEAIAVGHDLSRGFAKFIRHRPPASVSAVEDAESDARIAGEPTVSVSSPASASRSGYPSEPRPDGLASPFDPAVADSYGDLEAPAADVENRDFQGAAQAEDDALNVLREAGLADVQDAGDAEAEPAASTANTGTTSAGTTDTGTTDAGTTDAGTADTGTQRDRPAGRRGRSRVPVPA